MKIVLKENLNFFKILIKRMNLIKITFKLLMDLNNILKIKDLLILNNYFIKNLMNLV